MTKILYLEDEVYLGRIVKESLSSRGFEIRLISDGAKLIKHFLDFKPDICVLDVMVPNIDGFSLGKEIRTLDVETPIVFLTAKTLTEDVIEGFKSGGNDYVKKPFSMEELIVRIENLLQLKSQNKTSIKGISKIGLYEYHYDKFELHFQEEKISLSHRENELLHLLSSHWSTP